jgi:hypothetical protein
MVQTILLGEKEGPSETLEPETLEPETLEPDDV